ncbi:MAG TPA: creatininase [Solirubrobacteraceae bacterium]|jgi:creatinine amidohydrolase
MRTRLLAKLTWPEVAEAVARGAGVVLCVGSTEQHAYHLPLDTDVALPEELALAVAEPLDLVVAPSVAYGYRSRPLSGGGQGFVGTVSVSARTLMALVEDVLAELLRSGFKRIVLLNWHFENANFVYEAAWLAHERARAADARIMVVEAAFAELSPPVMEELFGDEFPGWDKEHAAVLETSLMLHLRPDTVLFDRAVDDEARRHPFWDVIPTPPDFVPASGALWKATRASREKGAVAWREIVANLEAAIREELPPYSPMSSSQTSGWRAMNDSSNSTHSEESSTTTSTPA